MPSGRMAHSLGTVTVMTRQCRAQRYSLDRLRPGDLFQVARLERLLFREPLGFWDIVRLWRRRDTRYLVIRRGRRVAAYIGFQILGPIARTISMGVHPDHRRRGLATWIQKAADRLAVRLGARWFTGEVRVSNAPQLHLLLGRLGWQAVGICRGFFGDGEDAVVVWHWLDSAIGDLEAPAEETGGDVGAVVHAEGAEEDEGAAGA